MLMRTYTRAYYVHVVTVASKWFFPLPHVFSGTVTLGDAINVQPFRNTMETIQLKGKYLRQALELSVTSYDTSGPDGGFLQVSGKICLFICL